MQSFSDENLIEIYRTAKGNQKHQAFDCLYNRHTNSLRNYFFFALGRDHEKAKDFAHDLFIKILESPEKFDSKKLFKPWIYKIASNMCKNEFRKQEVIERYNYHIRNSSLTYDHIKENENILREGIRSLKHEQRSLIVLRLKIELSVKEIAEIYNCPEGTIKSRLFYATNELSNYCKELKNGKRK
jgi:RNA polymerase sigma-70 factor, ECF subfamily